MLQALVLLTLLAGLLLIVALPIALVIRLSTYSRHRIWTRDLSLTLMPAVGFFGAGIVTWYTLGAGWHLPFLTTVVASVDSQKYGHPVEHAAENLLVAVVFFSVIGSIAGAGTARLLTLKRR
jgi:hypothetical protein